MEELLSQLRLQVALLEKDLPTSDNYSELDTRMGEIEATVYSVRSEIDAHWHSMYVLARQFRKPSRPRIEHSIDELLTF